MIPKIIHYIWIGNKPIPKLVEENNKVIGSDWEVKIWTNKDFTFEECPYIKETYKLGFYMYCVDALRFYILKKYGGVYLDCDVKLYRTPDNLLELPYAIGNEQYFNYSPNSGIVLSEPNNKLITKIWNYYKDKHFIYDNHIKIEYDTDVLRRLINDEDKAMVSSINEYKKNVANKICIFKYDGWETYNKYVDYSFAEHCHHGAWSNLNIHHKDIINISNYNIGLNNNIDIKADNLKIFLVAHKPINNYIPKDKRYVIIAQTKNVTNDYNDNFHNIIDISNDEFTKDHNICYGEGCAMRYLWKHPELLPDYVCFGHYRRYFFDFLYDEDKIIPTINYHGAITKYRLNKYHLYFGNNITGMYTDHFLDDINTFINILEKYAPKYFDTFVFEQCESCDQYGFNCFAMKKTHFLEMCEMCFNVLDHFDEVMGYKNNDDVYKKMVKNNNKYFMSWAIKWPKFDLKWQRRLQGFLLEYLTELYYRKKFKIYNCYHSFTTPID